jgi:hypothetical protein
MFVDAKALINSAVFLQCNGDKLIVVCIRIAAVLTLLQHCTDISLQRLDP